MNLLIESECIQMGTVFEIHLRSSVTVTKPLHFALEFEFFVKTITPRIIAFFPKLIVIP